MVLWLLEYAGDLIKIISLVPAEHNSNCLFALPLRLRETASNCYSGGRGLFLRRRRPTSLLVSLLGAADVVQCCGLWD
jgi:hypothetical protein